MDEEQKSNEFAVGYVDQSGDVMVIFVPIKAYSENPDGTALLRGKMDEAKAIALMNIQKMRTKKDAVGLIKPNGAVPMNVA